MTDQQLNTARLVLVTGPSGAGRSSATNVLEDLGYDTIANVPLSLLPRLLDGPAPLRPLAIGIGSQNRGFSTAGLLDLIDTLAARPDTELSILQGYLLKIRKLLQIMRISESLT